MNFPVTAGNKLSNNDVILIEKKSVGPNTNIESDYSKLNLIEPERAERLSDSRFDQLGRKVKTIPTGPTTFHFRRKTEKISPRTGQSSVMSKHVNTSRSMKKHSVQVAREPGTFLFLGNATDANPL